MGCSALSSGRPGFRRLLCSAWFIPRAGVPRDEPSGMHWAGVDGSPAAGRMIVRASPVPFGYRLGIDLAVRYAWLAGWTVPAGHCPFGTISRECPAGQPRLTSTPWMSGSGCSSGHPATQDGREESCSPGGEWPVGRCPRRTVSVRPRERGGGCSSPCR